MRLPLPPAITSARQSTSGCTLDHSTPLHGSGTRAGSPSTADCPQVDLSHNSLRALPDEIGMCHSLQARASRREGLHAAGGRGACGSRLSHATRAPHYRPASSPALPPRSRGATPHWPEDVRRRASGAMHAAHTRRTRGVHARTERCVVLHAPVTPWARWLRRLLLQRLNVGCNKLTSLPDTLAGLGRWPAALPTRCTGLQHGVLCCKQWCTVLQQGVLWCTLVFNGAT